MDSWSPSLEVGRVTCLFPNLCSIATDGLWRFFWEAPKSLKHLARAVCSSSLTPLVLLHRLSEHGESLSFSLMSCLLTWEDPNLGACGSGDEDVIAWGCLTPSGFGVGVGVC